MDIDDAFREYMTLIHPNIPETDPYYPATRNAFYSGMASLMPLFRLPPAEAQRALEDVMRQILKHGERAEQGMEQGYTDTDFGN